MKGDRDTLKATAQAEVERRKDELIELSLRLHANPEIAFQEEKASAWLADYLENSGFQVERGICQIKTAFRASYGNGEPRIAFLAEYDALPGLGHACGHNIIGTASTAAGLAAKAIVEHTGGTVLVIGTPAEEAAGGKAYLVERGAFAGLDCAMLVHPGNRNAVISYSLACIELEVEYHGKASHAAAKPEEGINALDAMLLAFQGIGLLRQQLRDSARIHGIITDGGQAVNVIPAHTAASLLLRAEDDDYLEVVREKTLACFQAGAEATGCQLKYRWGEQSRYRAMRTNVTLARAFAQNLETLGRSITEQESPRSMGSTDMGNVSAVLPAIHPSIAIAPSHVPIHTEEFRELSASQAGHAGLIDAAKALAMTAVDLLYEPELLAQARREFERD
ncbi:MAG TPA: M20 family metallopeptidase [Dehalococcoidia bacterium]|nr:M20 family metallopeptidase [Dehalococcoidia bacterium]